jgi:predicted molibdopterin-dependent oxidoreductase YjgC
VLEAAAAGKLQALVIVDYDLLELIPDRQLVERALKGVPAVIYCGPFANSTSAGAHVHLPLGTWAHREGLVVNLEWRVQKRCRASIDSIAPSVLDVINSICAEIEWPAMVVDESELRAVLALSNPLFSCGELAEFPDEGVIFSPAAIPSSSAAGGRELPAEFTGTSEHPLVLVPKRFLYNDREEIRYSPVFDKVSKPFFAFMHPADMQAHGCAEGASVILAADGGAELTLPVKGAAWVRQGSVVINDYNLNQPANRLVGAAPTWVAVKTAVGAREE